jgi:23S rRNA (uridine2552-2'-O)-methyltransferase
VLRERLGPAGRIVAVDVSPMDPIAGVSFVHGDVRSEATRQAVRAALGGHPADLVLCDLAPHISGIDSADQARSVALGELAVEFAIGSLQPGGDLVVKAFQGEGLSALQQAFEKHFAKVSVRKPKASRDRSREVFLVGRGFGPARSGVSDAVRTAHPDRMVKQSARARPKEER